MKTYRGEFDFSTFPTLTTERLLLHELLPADAADVFIFRSDPEVQKFNAEPMQHLSEAHAFIEEIRSKQAAQEELMWAVTFHEKNAVVGLIGFGYWNRYHHRAEVGYDLAHAYWGQGLASEAVKTIIDFGFQRMHLNRIEAGTIADNLRSVRLLERLGFRREGTRRGYSLEDDGTYHDSAMYGLLRCEYRKALHRRG